MLIYICIQWLYMLIYICIQWLYILNILFIILYYNYRIDTLTHFIGGILPEYVHSGAGGKGNSFIADVVFNNHVSDEAKRRYFASMESMPTAEGPGYGAVALRDDVLNDGFTPHRFAKARFLLAMCSAGGNCIFYIVHLIYYIISI